MTNYLKLPTWADKENILTVVETPRGSCCKLEFDRELRVFTLSKALMAGLTYPYDWGFIPSTLADDGDPLDVLVMHDGATYRGTVLRCRPIGVLKVLQVTERKRKRNDRVVAVPQHSFFAADLPDVRNLPATATEAIGKVLRCYERSQKQKARISWLVRPGPSHQAHKSVSPIAQGFS
ncbi:MULTISPECIES: inorganic diphosphatase [Bradyrhizobium]|nr:inorganic diphosphatase [Bradyrhizobium vignae]